MKKLLILILLLVLLSSSAIFVLAETDDYQNVDYDKSEKIDDVDYLATINRNGSAWIAPWNIEGEDSFFNSWLSYEHSTIMEAIPGWNPVDEWEIQQCKLKLTSEFEGVTNPSALSGTGFFMGTETALTMQAKTSFYGDETTATYFENSLGWYIEPYDDVVVYSIQLEYADGSKEFLVEEEEASVGGTSNFKAWTSEKLFVKAYLIQEDNNDPFQIDAIPEAK